MNKTIIININGIVFHIEEDAYEVLIQYMNEIKQHFGFSADSYEIVNDIENRLAEMFAERLAASGKEVIVLTEVQEVIAQMGKPSDFEVDAEAEEPTYNYSRSEKKLFRDTEDRIIGGVCAGIGHYFDVEPRWIRVATILLFLFFGTGIFLYLLLWIVMPKAVTRADRMAMKGEAPNLQNFKKNFEEEMASVKENLGKAQEEVKPFFQRLGRFVEQLFSHLGKFLGTFGKLIFKLIGAFIVGIGLMILFALFVGLLAILGIWNGQELPNFPFNIVNPEDQVALYVSAFLVVVIPLVSLILFSIRVIFNRPKLNNNISYSLLVAWLIALSFGLYFGFKTGGEFKQEARFSQTVMLPSQASYYLDLNSEKYLSAEDSVKLGLRSQNFKGKIMIDHGDIPDNFELSIEKSDTQSASLEIEYKAKGPSFQQALEAAKKIQYRYLQQDSSLVFDPMAYIKSNERWRDQEVNVVFTVPLNTRLIINPRLNRYLNNYNLNDCKVEGEDDDKPSEWIMKNEGLVCANDSLYQKNQLKKGLR